MSYKANPEDFWLSRVLLDYSEYNLRGFQNRLHFEWYVPKTDVAKVDTHGALFYLPDLHLRRGSEINCPYRGSIWRRSLVAV